MSLRRIKKEQAADVARAESLVAIAERQQQIDRGPTCFDKCGTEVAWIHLSTGYLFCKPCSIENGREDSPQAWIPYETKPDELNAYRLQHSSKTLIVRNSPEATPEEINVGQLRSWMRENCYGSNWVDHFLRDFVISPRVTGTGKDN